MTQPVPWWPVPLERPRLVEVESCLTAAVQMSSRALRSAEDVADPLSATDWPNCLAGIATSVASLIGVSAVGSISQYAALVRNASTIALLGKTFLPKHSFGISLLPGRSYKIDVNGDFSFRFDSRDCSGLSTDAGHYYVLSGTSESAYWRPALLRAKVHLLTPWDDVTTPLTMFDSLLDSTEMALTVGANTYVNGSTWDLGTDSKFALVPTSASFGKESMTVRNGHISFSTTVQVPDDGCLYCYFPVVVEGSSVLTNWRTSKGGALSSLSRWSFRPTLSVQAFPVSGLVPVRDQLSSTVATMSPQQEELFARPLPALAVRETAGGAVKTAAPAEVVAKNLTLKALLSRPYYRN